MSDDPTPPDWSITVFPGARTTRASSYTPAGLSQTQMDTFTQWNQNVAGRDALAAGDVPVSGAAVNGTVTANSVGLAPATSVAVHDTNLLVSQNFSNADTVVSAGGWSWFGDDGTLTPGCARIDCTGYQDDLVSNEVFVVPNENLSVSVWVKWANLAYTGTAPVIVLGIEKYRKGRDPDTGGVVYLDVGGADIVTIASPGATGDWEHLTGTYVVPAKGVDQLRFRFAVENTATFGYVLWDEAEFKKLDLIPDAAVPGVGTTVDNIVTNLYGGTGTGYTHTDESVALASTAQALTTNASNVSQIQASGSSGTIAGDDFSYTGAVTSHSWGGTNFAATYFAGDGNNAVFQLVGGVPANTDLVSRYDWQGTGAVSSTDYQKVQGVLSSASASGATIALYGRISADWTSWVRFLLNGNGTYQLSSSSASVVTILDSGSCTAPGAGATITLYCGDKATTAPRKFRAEINGTTVSSYTDTSTTNYGATYRKWGWGGSGVYVYYYGYTVWWVPASLNQWIGVDQ